MHELSANFFKKKFLVTKKSLLTCNKKNHPDVSHQFATQLLYIQHESNQTIAKIGYMVKVFANTMRLPGSNPSHNKNENRETWYVSRDYDPRTEVRRGGTPEVLKL